MYSFHLRLISMAALLPHLSRRFLTTTGIVVVAFLLGAGVYYRIQSTGGDDSGGEDEPTGPVPAAAASGFSTGLTIPVEGAPVTRGTLVLSVGAAGQAAAWTQTVVTAQVGGRLVGVPVRENAVVAPGRPLVQIDPAEFRLAVDEAEAQLRTAQAQYEELVLLNEEIENAEIRADRARFARAKSGLDQAQVSLRKAQLNLQRTRLGAPFAGRVASLKVVPGQWVTPGEELMTVLDLDPIKVEVQVLESEVGYLSPGREARVTFAAFPEQAFAGRIATINPLVESGTRTARVTVLVPNPEGRILPGMYARVALQARNYPDRVLVPRSALLERDRRTMLFVYEGDDRGGQAKWRYVTPGLLNDSVAEIVRSEETDSVRPGEVVLTDGHYTLIHDARVRLVDDVEAAGGRPN
jgi:membrane fusion protein (multidrug efflux system)